MRNDPNAAPLIKSYADALERYRSGEIKYVKLLDGGLVDNYGLAGFTIARLASESPFGPLAPQEAVKLRRFLFLVVDSGRAPSGQVGADGPRSVRRRSHHGVVRHRDRIRRDRQLFGLRRAP